MTEAADVRRFVLHGRGASPSAVKLAWEGWWSGGECECRHEEREGGVNPPHRMPEGSAAMLISCG